MKLLNILNSLEKVEMTMAGFYEWLSEQFSDHEEAAGFFYRMSMQEKAHASMIRFARRLVHASPSDFDDVPANLSEIENVVDLIQDFRSRHPEPTLGQALLFAMKMESELAENIHRSVVIDSNPEVANVINSLAAADREHHDALKAFACSHKDAFDEPELTDDCP
jgi:rubrerythrin